MPRYVDTHPSPVMQSTRDISIRSVESVQEMTACVELQQRIWGYSQLDTVPDQIFVVARKTGGQVMIAYDDEEPVGFALAFAAFRAGQTYLHSHMVAVLDEYQNRGVGRLLKLAQRDDALARSIDLVEWTFDPLQLKNAYFNIERLGAIARHYIPNLYGRTSSPLHAGLPTDRLVAEWWIRSSRVERILSGTPHIAPNRPQAQAQPQTGACRVSIPAAIREICHDDPARAESIQSGAREQFLQNFASGRAVTGFELTEHSGSYLLEPYEN